ncbi:hypothetical protein CAOG_05795 [Capsaspora owczarzaki ATCC 30864]|uniref:hypothetical protein n=1 Tax=Capsaspora owczarzaki (strain ATCC 30864) TaxID=595528 RepID=UPI0001FE2B42|nr:hypothetical protein CAOG_05795 [Capsaspora owczarzaki ATCC 30864]|eukprot:XP_004345385.1 hypothetical protein CAOG_05795 [Capsaspora owczarzaki ATCC 30864]
MDLPASAADPKPNARTASAASFDDVDASQSTKRARANNQQVVDNASHGASQQLTAMKNAQRSLTAGSTKQRKAMKKKPSGPFSKNWNKRGLKHLIYYPDH